MREFICIKCKDRKKGCTFIAEDDKRLPLTCVNENTRMAIVCHWMAIPDRVIKLESIFPFE